MPAVSGNNFGLLIAYLLPGFAVLSGLSATFVGIHTWLATSDSPTVGGFLYSTLASLTAGLLISTVRWLIVDNLHHATGVHPPDWQFTNLQDRLQAFELLVESHYRYYQFYANMAVATVIGYLVWRFNRTDYHSFIIPDIAFVIFEGLLLLGSRDTLRKYYERANALLAEEPRSDIFRTCCEK